jgi:hypothetical protein
MAVRLSALRAKYPRDRPRKPSSFFDPNILLSALFSNTLGLCASLLSETNFHTHTEPQEKIVLCVLIFIFLDSRREDKRFWTELQQALAEINLFMNEILIYYCQPYHFGFSIDKKALLIFYNYINFIFWRDVRFLRPESLYDILDHTRESRESRAFPWRGCLGTETIWLKLVGNRGQE